MTTYAPATGRTELVRTFLNRTYSWMAAGLALTAGTAYLTAGNLALSQLVSGLTWPLIIAQFALVLGLSFLADRLSPVVAGILFMVYAGLTGLTFSSLLFVYSPAAVGTAFLTSAGAFAGMSAAGYLTKRDLSGWSRFLLFALLGLILAMVANFFFHSGAASFAISVVGVLVFAGLTAYDTQKLKLMAQSGLQGRAAESAAINGALVLYLDFINMFLFFLRLLSGDRD
ncbi:Bax inhibitor-1 family protein [Deinococcus sp. Marseille-Q6407]|uniref:Bax inhibitor-1/YccA family protein n=1 Tax=Deinococcus sp. Marseille-Q6407 TaxID=2969223 RepID=UPI0021C07E4D|nr:Bax inhibitor-1/YccA family protein [Deinococcus sp. Marseille-Q6407]